MLMGNKSLSKFIGTAIIFGFAVMYTVAYAQVPPPPPPPPKPPTPPTLTVFFNFESADVPAEAGGVLKEAATLASDVKQVALIYRKSLQIHGDKNAVHETQVSVSIVGNCDTAEEKPSELSLARARAVSRALANTGALKGITVKAVGAGATRPLVATPANTREPKNRSVLITFALSGQ